MSCVNIKHPEFIELTKVLDLHPDFLRDIIYEYQNSSSENEGLFPSPEYVREVIQGKSMTDATEKHKEVWETFYKEPKIGSTYLTDYILTAVKDAGYATQEWVGN